LAKKFSIRCRLEEIPVVVTPDPTIGFGRNDRGLVGGGKRLDDAFIGVVCLVSKERIRLHVRQKMIGPGQIVRFSASQEETDRVAQSIDENVDFCAQSAARTADRLVAGFFCAPALC
jgi:hypothetical protein